MSTGPKGFVKHIQVYRPRVVHVEQTVSPSDTTSPESPIGPSAGARNAMIITSSSPPGPLIRCLTESPSRRTGESRVSSSARRRSGTGIVRQQHGGVLVDVFGRWRRRSGPVQMRDVEEVAVA